MFESQTGPRVFGVPLGQDFSTALHDGLRQYFKSMSPSDVARVEIYVNTRRMQRRLTALFHEGGALLLPRIRLVTDLAQDHIDQNLPPAISPLRRRLEVAQLVKGLLEADPTLASQDSAIDLAESIVALMNEMQGEGVLPEAIADLDISDQSGHWERALSFIKLVQPFFEDGQLDGEGRQRSVIESLIARWIENTPSHPVIVAGSTGSRGATSLFMQAVAQLPQGAVILPGLDCDMPSNVWDMMEQKSGAEDHPQYRFKAFCNELELHPSDIETWGANTAINTARTQLVSLSLRPAPVTHQWINDGPDLGDLVRATEGITMLEAASPRTEADAIAARLRQAVEDNQTAALISPDRILTRQVTAALDRWNIVPDDSAGLPLQLTAPGRFLRHIADLFCEQLDAEQLLVLLRHPLSHSDRPDRGDHAFRTNALELHLRRYGPPFPTAESLTTWAQEKPDESLDWVGWISSILIDLKDDTPRQLTDHVARHIDIAERLAVGPDAEGSGELWKKAAGREALRAISELQSHADAGGQMSSREYRRLVNSILAAAEVRDRDAGHPQVLIWGTLEARVQS
ncbi:MAG: double-strand break repair protein AddB, partial [Octadecabacter sp.]